ncbi:MAG: Nif3-like dinuclear metal center hexameric protein [Thermoflavifilum sp.]|nr:Nif3-like dinuclear metal center hexameric protein [Thermoflavifilum sp.]MCL6514935.1 Nif3-like dinuclear metal center hexameric protein [Alicyclobacillus sp.]
MEAMVNAPALPLRLRRVSEWVRRGGVLADIGSDHALLPVHAVATGLVRRAIATDLRQGPLAAARRTVERFGLVDAIELRLGDGLSVLSPGEADTVVIAGMGGETMAQMLSGYPLASIRRWVLQPMNAPAALRRVLDAGGMWLRHEEVLMEHGRLYVLIVAEPPTVGRAESHSDPAYTAVRSDPLQLRMAYEFGPLCLRRPSPELGAYMYDVMQRWERAMTAARESRQPAAQSKAMELARLHAAAQTWYRHSTRARRTGEQARMTLTKLRGQAAMSTHASTETTILVGDVVAAIEAWAPIHLALEGDNPGLQLGRVDKPVRTVCLGLDPYPATVDAALKAGADLLITHHPLFFRPLRQLDTASARGAALARAVAADLAIYSAHTNLDVAEGGVNDVICARLGLQDPEVLDVTGREALYKLVVFVPEEALDTVRDAVCAAGAGHIGRYSHCTFRAAGEGTFLPEEGAQPYLGQVGRLERAREYRLETIVPAGIRHEVVDAMLAAHPYEEVAYDLYPLALSGKAHGIGRVGNLPEPVRLADFAHLVKQRFGLAGVRYAGDPQLRIERVAVLGGSGRRWVRSAIRLGAQVLVTSDMDHHSMAEAWQDGLAVIDATHAALERPVLEAVAQRLRETFGEAITVHIVDVPEDPFHWV